MMKRADGRIGHVKKHETSKEVLSPGSKLQNLLQKFNRSWRRNPGNGPGRINSRRLSLKLNMALKITPSNRGMNRFLGLSKSQAASMGWAPPTSTQQATSVQGTSSTRQGHKLQATRDPRSVIFVSLSPHKVLWPKDRGPLAGFLP